MSEHGWESNYTLFFFSVVVAIKIITTFKVEKYKICTLKWRFISETYWFNNQTLKSHTAQEIFLQIKIQTLTQTCICIVLYFGEKQRNFFLIYKV